MYKKVFIAAVLAGIMSVPAMAQTSQREAIDVILTNVEHRGRCRDCGPRPPYPPHHGWRDRGRRRHHGSGRFTIYFSI